MGQEQSSPGEGGSLSFLQKATGISPKPSGRAGKIVVVNPGTGAEEEKEDPDLQRLNDIPQFYPILRASLNIPGLKDPPDLYSKFSPRPVLGLCRRLQDHYTATSEIVAAEQGSLGTRIREIDYAVATLLNFVSERTKAHSKCVSELVKIRELNVQLKKVTASLQEILPSVQSLNEFLPPSERLDPLNLDKILDNDRPSSSSASRSRQPSPGSPASAFTAVAVKPEEIEEQRVVDKNSDQNSNNNPKQQ